MNYKSIAMLFLPLKSAKTVYKLSALRFYATIKDNIVLDDQ